MTPGRLSADLSVRLVEMIAFAEDRLSRPGRSDHRRFKG